MKVLSEASLSEEWKHRRKSDSTMELFLVLKAGHALQVTIQSLLTKRMILLPMDFRLFNFLR